MHSRLWTLDRSRGRRSWGIATALAAAIVAALVAALLSAGSPTSVAAAPKPPANVKGLKILLTNDDSVQGVEADGSDGAGLYELRKALCAAGADVLVVGPWGQQSGQGGRITTDRSTGLTITPVTPPEGFTSDCSDAASGGHVYGVCHSNSACEASSPSASPADTVKLGVENFLPDTVWPAGPDLVLTGINWGQNAGAGVIHSGTTTAAVTAHKLGVPALAFSSEFDLFPCATQGLNCPEYAPAAAFAVKLLGKLRAGRHLKPSLLLNVNFPYLGEGEKAGKPALNVLGDGDMIAIDWAGAATVESGGTYRLGLPTDRKSTNKNSDTQALKANRISIVAMDGDWTAKPSKKLTKLVKTLK